MCPTQFAWIHDYCSPLPFEGIHHYLRLLGSFWLKLFTTVVPHVFVFLKYLWYDCNLFDQIQVLQVAVNTV